MPILEPESPDANEFPGIVRHDLQPPPQGASGEQQVVGSYGRTPVVRACTQLRRHAGIYSHSIVPGGFDVMSYTTRLTPLTSLMIRVAVSPRNFISNE